MPVTSLDSTAFLDLGCFQVSRNVPDRSSPKCREETIQNPKQIIATSSALVQDPGSSSFAALLRHMFNNQKVEVYPVGFFPGFLWVFWFAEQGFNIEVEKNGRHPNNGH